MTLLVGISAWGDPGLQKAGFYPSDVNLPADRLRYYAERFSVAEIDSTYHSFLTARALGNYVAGVPDGFLFNLKAFSMFTQHPTLYSALPRSFRERYAGRIESEASVYAHHLPQEALDDLWKGFYLTARAFEDASRLGVVLFQFPPWFHPTPDNVSYLAQIRNRMSDLPVAVEFRVGSWLNEPNLSSTLEVLKANTLSLVCVDEPQGLKTSVPPVAAVTAGAAIVRFHGRNSETWEKKGLRPDERFNYLYGHEELETWVPRIRQMEVEAEKVLVIFKNKHSDYPVRNALQMRELLGQR